MNMNSHPIADHPPLTLRRLPGRYAICRFGTGSDVPDWALHGSGLFSVTRIDDELSIIVDERHLPESHDGLSVESGWAAMRIVGRLDFALIGVLAKLTGALAAAAIPVCAVSTYDTDVLLVKHEQLDRAAAALASVAHVESTEAKA